MESSGRNKCLCCWWEGNGVFIKSSWTPMGASYSSCGTNKENPFSQFSSPLDVDETEVWVELWIISLQYISTQLMDASSSSLVDPTKLSSSNSYMGKRLPLENNSRFLWKIPSSWFSSSLFTQSSITCKTKCISWDSSIWSIMQSTLLEWLNGV